MLGRTSYTHDGVLNYARHLPHAEQLKLLEELAAMIRRQQTEESEEPLHSLLELEGLGAELWEGIDPQKYIEQERKACHSTSSKGWRQP